MSGSTVKKEKPRRRSGWSEKETRLLLSLAQEALGKGRPVRSVFEEVARSTGRQPSSIRNYYYLQIRERGLAEHAGFLPFSAAEAEELMRFMLRGQARGRSVRSLAGELGSGDKKKMLRYQNKYRSMLRSAPDEVRRIVAQLREEGEDCVDPFALRSQRRRGRQSRTAAAMSRQLAGGLQAAGELGQRLAQDLGALLLRLEEAERETARLQSELETALDSRGTLQTELARQIERSSALEQQLATLGALSRGFLTLPSGRQAEGAEEYAAAVSSCLDEAAVR